MPKRKFLSQSELEELMNKDSSEDEAGNDWDIDVESNGSDSDYVEADNVHADSDVSESEGSDPDDFDAPGSSTQPPKKPLSIVTDKTSAHRDYVLTPKTSSLKGKNGHRWSAIPPEISSVRTQKRNIVTGVKPGPIGTASNTKTPKESFSLFVNNHIIEMIVEYTNQEIVIASANYKNMNPTISATCCDEINAVIGILILSAVLKDNHLTLIEMWDPKYCSAIYRATMSRERFAFLLKCLRFDNKNTRIERKIEDPFAAIRDLWDQFISLCRQNYSPGTCCTIDEQLLAFRGRCQFRMYIPNKPAKYGIKLIMMCDSETKYLVNAEPYLGKGTKTSGLPLREYYVKELTKPIHGSNRNITTDNWFTSVPLVKSLLLHPYKLTLVGILRKNKREIPNELLDMTKRPVGTSVFCFDKETSLVSFHPKKPKNVLLLSTMHTGCTIDEKTNKPEIVVYYNKTKGGVDTFDQMCSGNSCSRKTKRWPLCVFFGVLNAAAINAYIIHNQNLIQKGTQVISRSSFMKTLAFSLVKPWLCNRLNIRNLPRSTVSLIRELIGDSCTFQEPVNLPTGRIRCQLCPRSVDRKTTLRCNNCKRPICQQHRGDICKECLDE